MRPWPSPINNRPEDWGISSHGKANRKDISSELTETGDDPDPQQWWRPSSQSTAASAGPLFSSSLDFVSSMVSLRAGQHLFVYLRWKTTMLLLFMRTFNSAGCLTTYNAFFTSVPSSLSSFFSLPLVIFPLFLMKTFLILLWISHVIL